MPAFSGVTGQAAAVIVAIAFQAFLAAQARPGPRRPYRRAVARARGTGRWNRLSLLGVYPVAERLLHWIRQRERPLAVAGWRGTDLRI
jgi:hypothetical protein